MAIEYHLKWIIISKFHFQEPAGWENTMAVKDGEAPKWHHINPP